MSRSTIVKGLLRSVITYRENDTTIRELDNAGLDNLSSDPQQWGRYRCAVAEMDQRIVKKTGQDRNSTLVYVAKDSTYREGGR